MILLQKERAGEMLTIYDDSYPILREVAKEVELPLSEEDRQLLFAMLEHLKMSQDPELAKKYNLRPGVGLAAPQVGVSKRMIALYFYSKKHGYVSRLLVNPKIVSESVKQVYLEGGEGCLSVPRFYEGEVFRNYIISVEAYDAIKNEHVTLRASGFEAIILQHEIDHLNGILFYDRILPPAQALFKKQEAIAI